MTRRLEHYLTILKQTRDESQKLLEAFGEKLKALEEPPTHLFNWSDREIQAAADFELTRRVVNLIETGAPLDSVCNELEEIFTRGLENSTSPMRNLTQLYRKQTAIRLWTELRKVTP